MVYTGNVLATRVSVHLQFPKVQGSTASGSDLFSKLRVYLSQPKGIFTPFSGMLERGREGGEGKQGWRGSFMWLQHLVGIFMIPSLVT